MSLDIDAAFVTLSSLSREYVKVRVVARRGSSPIDPTAFTVEFAFTPADTPVTEPTSTDWVQGSWETDDRTSPISYHARALIGPGTQHPLTDGTWDIWVKVNDVVEKPVRHVGRIIIT